MNITQLDLMAVEAIAMAQHSSISSETRRSWNDLESVPSPSTEKDFAHWNNYIWHIVLDPNYRELLHVDNAQPALKSYWESRKQLEDTKNTGEFFSQRNDAICLRLAHAVASYRQEMADAEDDYERRRAENDLRERIHNFYREKLNDMAVVGGW